MTLCKVRTLEGPLTVLEDLGEVFQGVDGDGGPYRVTVHEERGVRQVAKCGRVPSRWAVPRALTQYTVRGVVHRTIQRLVRLRKCDVRHHRGTPRTHIGRKHRVLQCLVEQPRTKRHRTRPTVHHHLSRVRPRSVTHTIHTQDRQKRRNVVFGNL